MLLYFLNKPVFTHQHVLPVVSLTNRDNFQGGWLQRGQRETRSSNCSTHFPKATVNMTSYFTSHHVYSVSIMQESANCTQSEKLFLTMMQTQSKKSETNCPHLLCLLWASDRMYWGRWFTVDWKGNKQAGCQVFTLISSYQTWCVLLTVFLFTAALMADYVWVTGICYNVWSVATWCHNSNKYTKTPMTPLSLTSPQWTAVFMYLCLKKNKGCHNSCMKGSNTSSLTMSLTVSAQL